MQIINSFKRQAFTLVEMLVALAVGAIVIMATYASYEMVDTQYKKNIDVANMHTSGRSIMQIIERDVRMAGFEYRHTSGANKGKKAFSSSIATPLDITDSGNKCCDEVKVIYDYFNEDTKAVKRIQIHYFTKEHDTPKKGKRYRLYKQVNDILPTAKTRPAEVMADFVEDLQLVNVVNSSEIFIGAERHSSMGLIVNDKFTKEYKNASRSIALAIGPNGKLYSGNRSGTTIAVSNTDDPVRGLYLINTHPVNSLAFGPDGMLYVGHHGRKYSASVSVINPYTGDLIRSIAVSKAWTKDSSVIAFSPNGMLYVGGYDSGAIWGEIKVYDPITGSKKDSFRRHPSTGESDMAFDSNGNLYTIKWHYQSGVYMYDPSRAGNRRFVKKVIPYGSSQAMAIDVNDNLYFAFNGIQKINLNNNNIKAIKLPFYWVQSIVINNKKSGKESLVNIKLTLRSEKEHSNSSKKYKYDLADYKFEADDKYKHDVFSTTVLVRNLAL